jgi:hypothetical protein
LTRLLPWGLGGNGVNHRADIEPRGLPEVTSFTAVIAGHRDDQVVTVDDHFGARDAEAVDTGGDDVLGLYQRVARRSRSVGGPCGEGDPSPALKVDAEFRLGLLVPGQEHQRVHADEQNQEKRQVAVGVHRRRRRCHVF